MARNVGGWHFRRFDYCPDTASHPAPSHKALPSDDEAQEGCGGSNCISKTLGWRSREQEVSGAKHVAYLTILPLGRSLMASPGSGASDAKLPAPSSWLMAGL